MFMYNRNLSINKTRCFADQLTRAVDMTPVHIVESQVCVSCDSRSIEFTDVIDTTNFDWKFVVRATSNRHGTRKACE
jgi:hypothetical protein